MDPRAAWLKLRSDVRAGPLTESDPERRLALRTGTLVDASGPARKHGVHLPTAVHFEVIAALGINPSLPIDAALSDPVMQSLFRTIRGDMVPSVEFDHIGIHREDGGPTPLLAARRSTLDSGEEVITVFLYPMREGRGWAKPRRSGGNSRLPSPSELTSELRASWCEPWATQGVRDPSFPVPGTRPDTSEETRIERLAGIRSLVFIDPVAAAQRAEREGDPRSAADCWILAGDPAGAKQLMDAESPFGWFSGLRMTLDLVS